MTNPIVSFVINKIKDGVKRQAIKHDCSPNRISLCIWSYSESLEEIEPFYSVLVDGVSKGRVAFKTLLDVNVDIWGYERICKPYIKDYMKKMCEQNSIELKKIRLVVYTNDKTEIKELKAKLINGMETVKPLTLEEILSS